MFSTFSQMEKNKSLVHVFVCVRQEKNQYECFFPLSFTDGKKILQISFCAFSQMEKTKKWQ